MNKIRKTKIIYALAIIAFFAIVCSAAIALHKNDDCPVYSDCHKPVELQQLPITT